MSNKKKHVTIDAASLLSQVPEGQAVASMEGDKSLGKGGLTLYHGTSLCHVASIMRDGIKPRGDSKANHPKMPSVPNRSYLTTWNALYYAYLAMKANYSSCKGIAVAEVILNQDDFMHLQPDEDAESAHNQISQMPRGVKFELDWRESIQRHGTTAYQGVIPPERIHRWLTYEMSESDIWALINYRESAQARAAYLHNRGMSSTCRNGTAKPQRLFETPIVEAIWQQHWDFMRPWQEAELSRLFDEFGVSPESLASGLDLQKQENDFENWLKGKPPSMPSMMKLA